MNWAAQFVAVIAVAAAVATWVARRVGGRSATSAPAGQTPPATQQKPPEFSDPLRLEVYALERAMSGYPEVTSAEELMLIPPFAALVEHFSRPEFDIATLEAYVTGEKALPSWAALHALARRPPDPAVATRALFWLNQFHAWTRDLTLRMLEAWSPADPGLAGRVLERLDQSWWRSASCLLVLDAFLRRRAAIGPLTLGERIETLDHEARERLTGVLRECEPELVGRLLIELKDHEGAATEAVPSQSSRPANPLAVDVRTAGRRHDQYSFPRPVLFPRASFLEAYAHLLRVLHAERRRSVLVSGGPGVGKTTLARALAAAMSNDGWNVFETSAIEINAGMSYVGQLEGRVQALLEEVRVSSRTVWLVRDVHQMLWAGRTVQSGTGILDMLVPAIESGELVLIGDTSSTAADMMLAERPDLARVLEIARIAPPRDEELEAIARTWVEQIPGAGAARWPASLVEDAVVLARHHLGALGMPGGLIRLLERVREMGEDNPAKLEPEHLLKAVSQLTGLPLVLLDDRQGLDVQALQQHFESRVIGQPEAVRCLVDRLALMKAGVTPPLRPYAVLLFVGPSGTGKTELVKALATYLFGSAERMVRIDMSELQDAGALDRLLAAGGVAAGGSLAARVRRQPFSVVLLDEFEKAHPRTWDLFLQVFDDGRLTDSRGETVDFRNTFIVLTSNLGARLHGGERLGFLDGQGFSAREVERAVANAFRPELLNRIDRVVVFQPLGRDAMRDILRKQINEAFLRRGLRRREWAVEIEESAIEFLLERGFKSDLGARPLERSIEQHLLAPLARTIVGHRAPQGDQFLFVRADGDRLEVEFVDPDAPDAAAVPPEPAAGTERDVRAIAWEAHGNTRELATLGAALAAIEERLADEAWSGRKTGLLAEAAAPGFWQRDDRFDMLGRAEYFDRIESGVRSARSLLTRLEGESRPRAVFPRPLMRRLAQQLLLLDASSREAIEHGPRDAFVVIEPGPDAGSDAASAAWQDKLLGMYERWARARGMRVRGLDPPDPRGSRAGRPRWLAVSGFAALVSLLPEEGLHVLESGTPAAGIQRTTARVRVASQPARPARSADELNRQAVEALAGKAGGSAIIRRYREGPAALARDSVRGWRTGRVERIWDGDFDIVPRNEDLGADA